MIGTSKIVKQMNATIVTYKIMYEKRATHVTSHIRMCYSYLLTSLLARMNFNLVVISIKKSLIRS